MVSGCCRVAGIAGPWIEGARAHPEVFAHKAVKQVAYHFDDVIQRLARKPARATLTIDSGWREVAETALAFIKRYA